MRCCWIILFLLMLCNCAVLHKARNYNASDSKFDKAQADFVYVFTEALKQKTLGNYDLSKDLLGKCIEFNSKSSASYYELSLIFDLLNDKAQAVYNAKAAVKFDRSNEWYLLQCAKLYQEIGNRDSVIYYFQKLTKARPDRYDFAYKLSQLYYEKSKFRKSLDVLKSFESKAGATKEIYVAKYRCYLSLNDQKNSLQTLNLALKSFPNEVRFYGLLAEHYASIGEKEKALQFYHQLLSFDPDNERGYLSMIDFYRNGGQLKESFELSNKFVCKDTFSVRQKIELISSYLNDKKTLVENKKEIKALIDSFVVKYKDNLQGRSLLADFFLLNNDLNSSRSELQYLLSKSKSNVLVWEKLLFVLSMMNDTKAIYEFTDEAISAFANNPLFYLYRGTASFQLKRYEDAISALHRGINFSKGSKDLLPKYYATLAEVYHAVKDNDKSDFYFEMAIQLDSVNAGLLNNYSYYLALRKVKLNIALRHIQRCVKLEPFNSTFLDTYAWVLYSSGRSIEAKLEIEKSIKYGGTNNVTILEHYCEILINLNMRNEALDCYDRIVQKGKDVPRIKEMLDLLKN